jgi:tungstate transport system substrate-binding protein
VIVFTTPGLAARGLTQKLTGAFEKESGRHARYASSLLRRSLPQHPIERASWALYRDWSLDAELTQHHLARLHHVFAYEDCEIVGPASDPAKVRGSPSAQEALRRIAQRKRTFCSPVDVAASANGERESWSAARINPEEVHRIRRRSVREVPMLHFA